MQVLVPASCHTPHDAFIGEGSSRIQMNTPPNQLLPLDEDPRYRPHSPATVPGDSTGNSLSTVLAPCYYFIIHIR